MFPVNLYNFHAIFTTKLLVVNRHFFFSAPLICSIPPSALSFETRYDAILGMFGHSGFFVRTILELRQSLAEALAVQDRPTILNIIIEPSSDRKAQSFNWLTESKL